MEVINEIWVWIATAIGGVSLAGIISTIIYACLRGAFNKTISKINVQKIADQATNKGIEKIKNISFTHSIQPLVESGLKKIDEHSVEVIKKELQDVQTKYDNVIDILGKLACYFDNSIGVAEEKKADLKEAIKKAKNEPMVAESVVVEEIVEPTQKQTTDPRNEAKTTTKVER